MGCTNSYVGGTCSSTGGGVMMVLGCVEGIQRERVVSFRVKDVGWSG